MVPPYYFVSGIHEFMGTDFFFKGGSAIFLKLYLMVAGTAGLCTFPTVVLWVVSENATDKVLWISSCHGYCWKRKLTFVRWKVGCIDSSTFSRNSTSSFLAVLSKHPEFAANSLSEILR